MSDSEKEIDWFKVMTGVRIEEHSHVPTVESSLKRLLESHKSAFPLIRLGWTESNDEVTLTEEQRQNTHILGLMGKGKSRLLEFFIRHDIDRLVKGNAPGLCLIDSGEFGATYNAILRYCRKVGFKKVCIIDPGDRSTFGKLPLLNLFGTLKEFDGESDDDGNPGPTVMRYASNAGYCAERIQNIFRILWEVEDPSAIARINQNLSSMTSAVHAFNGNLYDFKYFATRYQDEFNHRRAQIMASLDPQDMDLINLDEVFYHSSQHTHNQEFKSSIRRLMPIFQHDDLMWMFGSQSGINFFRLILDGWIVLCNLDPARWGTMQRRFLGTFVIDEIIHAMYALVRHTDYHLPFYLYIDEVGHYATRTLAEVIHYKRKSNIRLIMAHQQWDQIKNQEVLSAIKTCPLKFMFYCEREDRDQMVRLMYGGDLPDREVSYTLSQALTKQRAVFRDDTHKPRVLRMPDVPDVPADEQADREFKRMLYEQPHYRSPDEINQEINARFGKAQPRAPESISKKVSARPVEPASEPRRESQDPGGAEPGVRRTVPDDNAGGGTLLPSKKGRATRKISTGKSRPKKP